jgi:hypothetical protein
MQDKLTGTAEETADASVDVPLDADPIQTARDYGIDIGLINSLLDLPVIERIRRNDADILLDRAIRAAVRPRRS